MIKYNYIYQYHQCTIVCKFKLKNMSSKLNTFIDPKLLCLEMLKHYMYLYVYYK